MSRGPLTIAVCALSVAGLVCAAGDARIAGPPTRAGAPLAAAPAPAPVVTVPAAAPAPPGLPVLDYWARPRGFPDDPNPLSTAPVTEGVRPTSTLVLYDSPGGRPRGRLKPSISGLPVTVPIVERRSGWVAVLLPSVNRKIGWLPAGGWSARALRDHLVVHRRTHRLTWLHDGVARAGWRVATGTAATPTPLGRTFVLGRTGTSGAVYAGLDALALGSVPDDRKSVARSLRGGHTGFHSWYSREVFGRSVSNGCIRVPRKGQQALLKSILPGTTVTVVD